MQLHCMAWYIMSRVRMHQKSLLVSLDSARPVVADSHAIHDNNTSATADSFFSLPPLAILTGLLNFRLTICQAPMPALCTDDQYDIIPQPRLQFLDIAAIVAR